MQTTHRILELPRVQRPPAASDPSGDRHARARSAIHGALENLRRAHERLDDTAASFVDTLNANTGNSLTTCSVLANPMGIKSNGCG